MTVAPGDGGISEASVVCAVAGICETEEVCDGEVELRDDKVSSITHPCATGGGDRPCRPLMLLYDALRGLPT